MSRVIQLISHNQHLFALTDTGEIFALRKRRVKCRIEEYWHKVANPSAVAEVPPRFSLPEEYAPSPCQASASGESFVHPGQRESSLQTFHCVEPEPPETFTKPRPIPRPIPRPNTIDVMNPAPRRPTSIGSDGNYLPPTGD